jgi:hypothetical protein
MEYFLLSCGALYFAKRRKWIDPVTQLKKFKLIGNYNFYSDKTIRTYQKNNKLIDKLMQIQNNASSPLSKENNNEKMIWDNSYRVMSFNSAIDLNKLITSTDEEIGGDTFIELKYSLENESSKNKIIK